MSRRRELVGWHELSDGIGQSARLLSVMMGLFRFCRRRAWSQKVGRPHDVRYEPQITYNRDSICCCDVHECMYVSVMPSPKKQSEKNDEEKSYNRANNYDHPKQNRNRKPHEIPRFPARSKPLSLQAITHKTRKKQERDLHQEFPKSGNAPTASQRRDMHAYMRRWQCRCVYSSKYAYVRCQSSVRACTRDLLDSQPFTIAVQLQVQVSAGHMAKSRESPGNRRAVSSCSKALSGLRLHLPTRCPVSPVLVFERRPPCLSHPLTASQPSSCCAACCTAHRPLSRDLSATADLALPVSLALPRLLACLSHLLAFSPDFSPGSKKRKSEVPKY